MEINPPLVAWKEGYACGSGSGVWLWGRIFNLDNVGLYGLSSLSGPGEIVERHLMG